MDPCGAPAASLLPTTGSLPGPLPPASQLRGEAAPSLCTRGHTSGVPSLKCAVPSPGLKRSSGSRMGWCSSWTTDFRRRLESPEVHSRGQWRGKVVTSCSAESAQTSTLPYKVGRHYHGHRCLGLIFLKGLEVVLGMLISPCTVGPLMLCALPRPRAQPGPGWAPCLEVCIPRTFSPKGRPPLPMRVSLLQWACALPHWMPHAVPRRRRQP